jgi:tetratricopeptide (TPR) repeat protein
VAVCIVGFFDVLRDGFAEPGTTARLNGEDFQSYETSVTFTTTRVIDLNMSSQTEETGSLQAAMKHASQLLEADPVLAVEQLQAILEAIPNHGPALLLLAIARRRLGQPQAALEILVPLIEVQKNVSAAHFELGLTQAALGRGDQAILALRRAVKLNPKHPLAWRHLADHLMAIGDTQAGDEAYAHHIHCSTQNPRLQRAAAAMVKNDMATAERLLKTHLSETPTDVPAIRMLGEVAVRCGQNNDAENLFLRCLQLVPSFASARYSYAVLLHRRNHSAEALVEVERLLLDDPNSPSHRNLCAVVLSRIGEYARSIQFYARLLDEYPGNAKVWLSYGHVLKTAGQQQTCIDAYRQSININPSFGEAYWSLANLKTFRFTENDLEAMHQQVSNTELDNENRLHFHFAMGKAFEDTKDHAQAFEHYKKGNETYSEEINYNADLNHKRIQSLKKQFTPDFFAARTDSGTDRHDPIFIVGMPRSGSTLLEQILSSHSAVEGTTELPDIISMAKVLREEAGSGEIAVFAEVLASKSSEELRQMGEHYLETTRVHRKTDSAFFIDKMPNNFLYIGLIHLILPNAKIIDARRHPLGCCFSNFKQYYARGQSFSYALSDMAHFYRDYVELMAHFDETLPGRIHRVHYENTVADTESEVRRMLDYCGLPFEPGCLKFFENARPVRTASSEQVRQPIYREGTEQWLNYEAWLDPLKIGLGDVLELYPEVPNY